jgi:hypothetical protein
VFPQCDIISISLSVDKRVFVILMATRLWDVTTWIRSLKLFEKFPICGQ